jgi:putative ABC transport system permease protein
MSTLLQDLRYAWRLLFKTPSFTAVAIITLALGIGANTAIFTVVNAVLLRPLPFRDPSRLVIIAEKSNIPVISTSYQNWMDWRDQSHSFESVEATQADSLTLTGNVDPERLNIRRVTAGMFPMLGVNAQVGRTFIAEEDRAGGNPVVLLSYGLWQRRFSGSKEIIGKPINLDSQPYTVIGVLPKDFELLQHADAFLPFIPWATTLPDDRNWHPGILAIAHLKNGVDRKQAATEMIGITKRLEQQYPDFNTGTSADVVGLQQEMVKNVRSGLILLFGAVVAVLLIACVNVANLLLARAASRGREIAIRTSMGGSRRRIIAQLLTESVLLSFAGGLLGLLLGWAALGPLLKFSAESFPQPISLRLDPMVLGFTLAISLASGLVFGVIPAMRTAKLDLRETLNEGSRGSTAGPGQHRVRGLLVVGEIAMAVLLLVGAGLLLRSFSRLQAVPPGFRPDHLLVVDLPLSETTYSKPEQRYQFFDHVLERVGTMPGVKSAAAATFLPVSGGGGLIQFNITGRPPKSPHDYIAAGYRAISPHYFETLGVPLVQGRFIVDSDKEKAPAVVVINSTMAKTYFSGENPLGKRLQLGAIPDSQIPTMEIVGIVGDVLQGLADAPKAEMYLPYRQADQLLPVLQMSIVTRTTMEPFALVGALRSVIAETDRNQPLVKVRSMEQNIQSTLAQPRFRSWLIGIFSGIALFLAAIGIYGVMSYAVTQRTSEIGIRVTLGAQFTHILHMVVGEALRLALLGISAGLVGALAMARLLHGFVFGVSTLDPVTLVIVPILLLLVGLVASLLPALRAMRIDPMVALRYE